MHANRLIVAFNFPPFNDGSAVTIAKRIVEAGVPVDVISADLSRIRSRDESLYELVTPLVKDHHSVTIPLRFAEQSSVLAFADQGLLALGRHEGRTYESMHSRSMWPHSHFLAARAKIAGIASTWTAEFSDPVLWHVDATRRSSSPLVIDDGAAAILRAVGSRAQKFLRENATVLAWAQHVPFFLADEIVFTNDQQQTVMIRDAPDWFQAELRAKSTIAPHPTLPAQHYGSLPAPKSDDRHDFRIGYFGTFYPNRGGGEFLEAVSLLPREERSRLRLNVYSDNAAGLADIARRLGLRGTVKVRTPLPFLEFLKVTNSYDALLVNDIATSPFGLPSPFLPSKYSDYAGSSAPTMAITIPGSPLDQRDIMWKAHTGDLDGIASMLSGAIARRTSQASEAQSGDSS